MSLFLGAFALLSGCVAVHHSDASNGVGTTVNGLVAPHSATALVLGEHALDIAETNGVPATVRDGGVLVQVGGRYPSQPLAGGTVNSGAFWAVENTLQSREAMLGARGNPPLVVVGDPAITARIVGLEVSVDRIENNLEELGTAVLSEE